MTADKSATGSYNPTAGVATGNFNFPAAKAVGDPVWLLIAAAGPVALSSVPAGWTQVAGANMGTGGFLLLTRNGGYQASDGASLALTFTTTIVVSYSMVVLDQALASPAGYTVGAVYNRASSLATTAPAAAGTGAADTLVFSCDKASTHTGGPPPTAPAIVPASTQVSWTADPAASTPSTYVAIYSGAPAGRTVTYSTASSNGAALQVALAPGSAPAASVPRGVISAGAEVGGGAVLRGVISGGAEVAAGAVVRGVISGGVEVTL